MAEPSLLINTFVKHNEKANVDILSKIFIISECALGLNRSAILGVPRIMYTVGLFFYTAFVNAVVVWYNSMTMTMKTDYIAFIMIAKYIQYISCSVLSYLTWRRIRDFYGGLEKFDIEIGYQPKVSWKWCKIYGQVAIVSIFSILIFIYQESVVLILVIMPMVMINILENLFYAHMLHLLTTRLSSLNEGIVSLLKCENSAVDDRKPIIKMERLMEIYNIVITTHIELTNGIKWQLLIIITTSFIFVLGLSYRIAVDMIQEHISILNTIIRSVMSLMEFIPLFAPCLCSDKLKAEVHRLKQLLAAKLYEGGINKPSRSSARTLLVLTETRDLSFPLLRMVDISISLPFKFISLLVTYLIILLQFEKVFSHF